MGRTVEAADHAAKIGMGPAGNGCQQGPVGNPGHKGDEGPAGIPACPVRVLHDVVAIVIQTGRMTAGGLALPDNCKDKTLTGKVVAVGPGRYPDNYVTLDAGETYQVARFPMSVSVGDTVCFPSLVGLDVIVYNVKYHMVHEGDILAVIPGK
jgi:chaperonin GroES